MRFVLHVSDIHMGGKPADMPPTLSDIDRYVSEFLKKVREVTGDAGLCGIIFGGDYVDKGWFTGAADAVALMTRIVDDLHVNRAHVALCIGNHDLDLNAQDATFKKTGGDAAAARKRMYGPFLNGLWRPMMGASRQWEPVSLFQFGGQISVIGVDSCQGITRTEPHAASLPQNATDSIGELLAAARPAGSCVLLTMHHPPCALPETWLGIPGWDEIYTRFGASVAGVLYGNQHEQVSREVTDSSGKALYVGCRTFGKFREPIHAGRGATLVGIGKEGKVARLVDLAYVADRNEKPWLHGHWTQHDILESGTSEKGSFADSPPLPPPRKKRVRLIQSYSVYDAEFGNTIEGWVKDGKLLIQGRFAVHSDKLSVTWIDIERLLTDPQKTTEIASRGAHWLRKQITSGRPHAAIVGVDTNGAIIASRMAGMTDSYCTYVISRQRSRFHASYEKEFKIPNSVSFIAIVTDVISTGGTLNDIVLDVRERCKVLEVPIVVLSVFLSSSAKLGTGCRVTCLCDSFAMDVVRWDAAANQLPLDLDLRR